MNIPESRAERAYGLNLQVENFRKFGDCRGPAEDRQMGRTTLSTLVAGYESFTDAMRVSFGSEPMPADPLSGYPLIDEPRA